MGGGGLGRVWGGGAGQVGCERRIEVFVKIQKKIGGGQGGRGGGFGGVRVDVIEELKFLGKFTKGGGRFGGVQVGGFRVDVKSSQVKSNFIQY